MKHLFYVLCAVMALSSAANAAPARLLGQTELHRVVDGDVIHIRGGCPSRENRKVSALAIRVLRNDARINFLSVKYGNGNEDSLDVRQYFRQGSASRWIDLRGGRRCIDEVKIVGRTASPGPKAIIQVFGAN